MDKIEQLKKDIRTLKIQGATNVALSTLEGIKEAANFLGTENKPEIFKSLKSTAETLAYARPTEPLAQNAVRYVFDTDGEPPGYYLQKAEDYKKLIDDAKTKMALQASSLIRNGGHYITHCHSSTVVTMFKEAWNSGKRFSVYTTETRPLYQGRITATELVAAGLSDITFIIDDAVSTLIEDTNQKIDGIFIGADLLSKEGFVNKIGSLSITHAAQKHYVPVYTISILLKYDPREMNQSLIERRNSNEIWPDAPAGIKFLTQAFDYIPYTSGVNIICEEGILNGNQLLDKVTELYPFIIKSSEYFKRDN